MQAIFPVRTADGGPDTLASIVQVSGTSLTDTRPLAKKLNHLYQELFSNALLQTGDFSFPDGKDLESRIGFSGLLAGDNINNIIELLDKAYQHVRHFDMPKRSRVLPHSTLQPTRDEAEQFLDLRLVLGLINVLHFSR